MADIEIDDTTRDTLQHLADEVGLSVPDYLAQVAEEKQHERALEAGAAAFRRVIGEPGLLDRFDGDFGGLPPAAHHTPQAA